MNTPSTLLDHPRFATVTCLNPGRGCDEVFIEFVRANTPALIRTAYRLTGSTSAAEELVQDTLVRLYPRWGGVANVDAPLAYVRRAVTNQFLNERRRIAGREVVTDTVPDRPAGRSAESTVVDRDEVLALLRTLSRRQRTVLVLRYYDGLSDTEIAQALGSAPGTVRSLISRALATLRQNAQPAARPRPRPARPAVAHAAGPVAARSAA